MANKTPPWMKTVLLAAGLYNLVWGALVIFFPNAWFAWAGMEPPRYPELWQCIGMIVGVYGIGYAIAAFDPARHWPIVLVGLLGKVLGPIGFVDVWYSGRLPAIAGVVNITNDLIWWLPFAWILYYAAKQNSSPALQGSADFDELAATMRSQNGHTLAELSASRPVLVTFLRHAGCTFCREALADLSHARQQLTADNVQLALVHMGEEDEASRQFFAAYQMDDVERFSDPHCQLYRALGLMRGSLPQLLGPRIWWRGFLAAIVNRHGFGKLVGDGFQMPGVFVIHHGQVVASYLHRTAADRPDYVALACSVS